MYVGVCAEGNDGVKNEIVYSNLFAAAANEKVFSNLSIEDQDRLIALLTEYTEMNIHEIRIFSTEEDRKLIRKVFEKTS